MFRPWAAAATIVALLIAFAAAPHSHVHQFRGEEHHSSAATVRHAHVTAHPHDAEEGHDEGEGEAPSTQKIWRVDDFVFQQAATVHAPQPSLTEMAAPASPPLGSWRAAPHFHPAAHGPPPQSPRSPRAPPAVLPSFL
jgi:hypothetical protein